MSKQYNPVGWFEIPVTDMTRAKTFYEYVLGTPFEDHEMDSLQMAWFPMINEEGAYGAAGSLVKSESREPSAQGTLVYFTAPDLDAALSRAAEKGGRIVAPKTDIGEYGFIGLILDSEGNRVGLHSMQG